jgi:hypothetical protein
MKQHDMAAYADVMAAMAKEEGMQWMAGMKAKFEAL